MDAAAGFCDEFLDEIHLSAELDHPLFRRDWRKAMQIHPDLEFGEIVLSRRFFGQLASW
jgi:hypothetical protein